MNMRILIEAVRPLFENGDSDGYRLEYQNSHTVGTDQWEIYKPLRGQGAGAVFDTLCWFPKGTNRQIVKRHFWKKYKIDIDKLHSWQRLVGVSKPDQPSATISTDSKHITESELPDDWDLGGAWITSEGQIEVCDHGAGRHHADIALDIFGEYIETNDDGEYDDYARDAALDLAYDVGWVRINTRGHRSISIEWKVPLTKITKKSLPKRRRVP